VIFCWDLLDICRRPVLGSPPETGVVVRVLLVMSRLFRAAGDDLIGVENLTGSWWCFIEEDETEQGDEDDEELWPEFKKNEVYNLRLKIRW